VNLSSLAAALALAVLLTSGCGGSSDSSSDGSAATSSRNSDTFVEDDFSDPASGWSKDNDDAVLLDYADGGYRILMKTPGPRDARLSFGTPDEPLAVEAVSVEADATERAGPYSSGQIDEFEFHGVACWGADTDSDRLELGYKFVLTPEGHYGILRDDQSAKGLVVLAEGDLNFTGYGTTNRIRGECTAGGDRSTLLVLYVDGRKIARARDPKGPDRFPAIGLTVETSQAGTDILFDNVLALNPLAPRASTSEPAPENEAETGSEAFPESQARSSSKLCKKKGIRYSGSTAQGGEVCFTVTDDHKKLLEVGFTFVPANRCPEMATGTFRAGGEAGPTVTRVHVRSSGFTGTIEGAEASGILQDWDICKERTFAWRAHRVP
jgi:hypothetical protein